MALKLYMDQHVARVITLGLRLRNVDVVTAYEDGHHEVSDLELLDRATAIQRVLFSQDDDLVIEATQRQRNGILFAGVIYAHQAAISIGQCIRDLELIVNVGTEADTIGHIIYLPL